jgi:hypothetical protein
VVPTFLAISVTTASHPRPHCGWVRSVTCHGVPIHSSSRIVSSRTTFCLLLPRVSVLSSFRG